MQTIIWILNSERQIGEVSRDVYGGFVEHLGRNVYGGVYDPASATADEDGFRRDVLDLIRRLDMPITRYPGG
ncbi:MAG: alpha-N-arabinofuranosidase, partial [Lentisphaeria bacterium]|nr:alpha-N-arabinofuranosidase [Lentisphaeria bacterium]